MLVYPSTFNKGFEYGHGAKDRNVMGMVGDGYMNRKMILSRNALRNGFKNTTDKHNKAIHEFVHLLEREDGSNRWIARGTDMSSVHYTMA